MPEYLAPGVYVEEVDTGAKPIEGVSTSTAAFVGVAEKGPMNKPTLVTNWGQFVREFGGYSKDAYLAYSVYGFFQNGGKRCFIVRVADTDKASKAINIFKDGNDIDLLKITALNEGAWGKNISVKIDRSSQGSTFLFASSLVEDALTANNYFYPQSTKGLSFGGKVRICDRDGHSSGNLTVQELVPENGKTKVIADGNMGNKFLAENSIAMAVIEADALGSPFSLTLASTFGFEKGSLVSFNQPFDDPVYASLDNVQFSENRIGGARKFDSDLFGAKLVDIKRVCLEFKVQIAGLNVGDENIPLANIKDDLGKGLKESIRPWDSLMFGRRETAETVTVKSIAGGNINFSSPIKNIHPIGALISAKCAPQAKLFSKQYNAADLTDTVPADPGKKLYNTGIQGFKSGDCLRFSGDAGGDQDFEIISVDSAEPTKVEINIAGGALAADHKTVTALFKQDQEGVVVDETFVFKAGDLVEVTSGGTIRLMALKNIVRNRLIFQNDQKWTKDASDAVFVSREWAKTRVKSMEFTIKAKYEKDREKVTEEFNKLSINPESPRYILKDRVIKNVSQLIDIEDLRTPPVSAPSEINNLPKEGQKVLNQGGDDGLDGIEAFDFIGTVSSSEERSGIFALEPVDEVNILCIPDVMMFFGGGKGSERRDSVELVQKAMFSHCERLKDRFAVLDSIKGMRVLDVQTWRKDNLDSKYAAIYYPWIEVLDPIKAEGNSTRLVPASGSMAGIYARSDNERGVHKAPANEVVRGVNNLERKITKGQQEILNPDGINCIRQFKGRGIRVWGARTISSDPDWKYVNVRRLFIYVEESIEEGTQWVVFEPNDHRTWARVRQSVRNFLTNVWREGALQGRKVEDAFFVTCDETTMTQTDIDNGKLIMEIGIAPVKPAEFVIFRIGQWTAGAEIEEV